MPGHARRFAFALLVFFLIATSAPSVALLRRPLHDTAAGLLPLRIWASDVLHAGDWPLWYPYPRYGVPFTSLHFSSNVLSPLGVVLGAILPYNVWTLALEQMLWRAIGLAGAYAFARRHLASPVSAAAAAAVYVGSGAIAFTINNGTVFPGLMVAPWLVFGIDRAASSRDVRGALSAAGVLGLGGAVLVASGYPGTWLTAPALLAPYALVMTGARPRALALTALAAALGAALAGGMLSFILWETATLSLFGGEVRNAISTSAGALAGRSLLAYFLPTPTYLLGGWDANFQPQYLGAITALLLCASLLPSALRGHRFVRLGALLVGGLLLNAYAAPLIQVIAQRSAASSGEPLSVVPVETAIVVGVGLLLLFAVPGSAAGERWTRVDIALRLTTLWTLLVASENPVGSFFRAYVPPFSFVRWNYLYGWVATLMFAVIAWRAAERLLPWIVSGRSAGAPAPHAEHGRLRSSAPVITGGLGLLVASLLLFLPASRELLGGNEHPPERVGLIALAWPGVLIAVGVAAWLAQKRSGQIRPLWILAACLLFVAGVGGASFAGRDDVVGGMVPLFPQGRAVLDLIQITAVVAAAAAGTLRRPHDALGWVATLTVLDLAAATIRYAGETPPIHVPSHLTVTRSLAFHGTERFPETLEGWGFLDPAVTKRPTVSVWTGLFPELTSLDRQAGAPSIFHRFAAFPPRWWSGEEPRTVTVVPAELRGTQTSASAEPAPSTPLGPPILPRCDSGTPPAESTSATVTQLLSTRVRVEVRTPCERLLVYLDTWAPAWRARIDGESVPALRVNGAARGVVMPAGTHILEWSYRPDHLPLLLAATAASAVTAIALTRCSPSYS